MSISTVTGPEAIKKAIDQVDMFLTDENLKVFQLLGYFGIGKRTALQDL